MGPPRGRQVLRALAARRQSREGFGGDIRGFGFSDSLRTLKEHIKNMLANLKEHIKEHVVSARFRPMWTPLSWPWMELDYGRATSHSQSSTTEDLNFPFFCTQLPSQNNLQLVHFWILLGPPYFPFFCIQILLSRELAFSPLLESLLNQRERPPPKRRRFRITSCPDLVPRNESRRSAVRSVELFRKAARNRSCYLFIFAAPVI